MHPTTFASDQATKSGWSLRERMMLVPAAVFTAHNLPAVNGAVLTVK